MNVQTLGEGGEGRDGIYDPGHAQSQMPAAHIREHLTCHLIFAAALVVLLPQPLPASQDARALLLPRQRTPEVPL